MPDLEINIGDRKFFVTCRSGEEHFLNAAAKMLDAEATPLQEQMGRLPEARMLLMAGLMLADRTASLEDDLRQARSQIADLQARAADAPASPATGPDAASPGAAGPAVTAALAQLATQAEHLATSIEARLA